VYNSGKKMEICYTINFIIFYLIRLFLIAEKTK
ncbi:unnamed protein product, partial [marine sediment metagenome]